MHDSVSADLQELDAFIDDQLGPEARRGVQSRLAADPESRAYVNAGQDLNRDLHALFDPIMAAPVPPRLRSPEQPWRRWRMPLGAVAAGLVLLASGTWIGVHLQLQALPALAEVPHVVEEAAMAFAVYSPEVRHPVEVGADQEAHLVHWLTKRLGSQVVVPKLEKLGFLLVGGRLLASDDGPGALFMYENTQGRRITLYLCQNEKAGLNTAFRFAEHENISVFYWFDGPFSYALAGEMDRAGLMALAQAVYQQVVI